MALPVGPGVVARYLRIADEEQVRLGHIVSGYDGLATMHGDGARVVLVTTESLAAELDALLRELREQGAVRFEVIEPADGDG